MFCRYSQAERETLVSEKVYYDDMALEENKTNQNLFNEDIVPHFTFLSSACVEGLSRVLTHCILESFPTHMEKSAKTTGQDTEITSVYFVL